VHAPSGLASVADGQVNSSDEDTSDEAFAARHAVLEAEEQQRFNSFAGENRASDHRNPFGTRQSKGEVP